MEISGLKPGIRPGRTVAGQIGVYEGHSWQRSSWSRSDWEVPGASGFWFFWLSHLSSLTRDRTHMPCTARWILNRGITGDIFDYCPWGWCTCISWVGNQGLLLNVLHGLHCEKLSRPEYQLSRWRQSAPGESLMELLSESCIARLRTSSNGTKKTPTV